MYKIIKVKDYRQIKAKIMQLKALDEGKVFLKKVGNVQ